MHKQVVITAGSDMLYVEYVRYIRMLDSGACIVRTGQTVQCVQYGGSKVSAYLHLQLDSQHFDRYYLLRLTKQNISMCTPSLNCQHVAPGHEVRVRARPDSARLRRRARVVPGAAPRPCCAPPIGWRRSSHAPPPAVPPSPHRLCKRVRCPTPSTSHRKITPH